LLKNFFEDFDTYLEKKNNDDNIYLLGELKNVLKNGCSPSDILKSYLEEEDDRYYLYSRVISQIYEVIKI